MEILKKVTFAALLLLGFAKLSAQPGPAMQKAFHDSYINEYKKNYTAAIANIISFHSESNYETNLRLGWLNFLNKNYTTSAAYYEKAVSLKPNSIEARFGYIKPLSLLTSWNKVLEQYNTILKIDPQNAQANYWTGIIYYNRKEYEVAYKYFSHVINVYPFDYDGNQMSGWSTLMAGKKGEAKVFFEKALLIKPDDASCLDGLNKCK